MFYETKCQFAFTCKSISMEAGRKLRTMCIKAREALVESSLLADNPAHIYNQKNQRDHDDVV